MLTDKQKKATSVLPFAVGLLMLAGYQNCGVETVSRSTASLEVAPFSDDHPVEAFKSSTTFDPLLADRYYIVSLLTDVFGPKMRAVETAGLAEDAVDFSSPCSLYENYKYPKRPGVWVQVDSMNSCDLSSQAFNSVNTNSTAQVARQAQMAHACSDLTSTESTLTYALAQIAPEPIPAFTEVNLSAAYSLFYRVQGAPTASILDSLKVMAPGTGPTRESWRNVIHTLCVSSQWQVL